MKELKRIFSNRRLVLGLLLIFLINGILFYNAQTERDFGLDLSGRPVHRHHIRWIRRGV